VEGAAAIHKENGSVAPKGGWTHTSELAGRRERPERRPGEGIRRAEIAQRDEQDIVRRDRAPQRQIGVRFVSMSAYTRPLGSTARVSGADCPSPNGTDQRNAGAPVASNALRFARVGQ
jgi:hypothetical protein